jgi:hypothetical protein
MPNTPNKKLEQTLSIDAIASPGPVVHPALDWVDDQLIVGVVLKDGSRAALSSTRGLIELEQVGRVCERDGNFESSVTPEIATSFTAYLKNGTGTKSTDEARELLGATSQYFKRFVVFPEEWWPDVLAAWNWGTYLFPIFLARTWLWEVTSRSNAGQCVVQRRVYGVPDRSCPFPLARAKSRVSSLG